MINSLNDDTVDLLEVILEEKVQNKECFYALDITNEAKLRGSGEVPPRGFGSHTTMKEFIHEWMRTAPGYDGWLAPLPNGRQAVLYFPVGTPQATLAAHQQREVKPLLPVDVIMAQKSQQATGVQVPAAAPAAAPPGMFGKLGKHLKQLFGS